MTTQRSVIGHFEHADGTPWAGATITYHLMRWSYTAGAILPSDTVTETTSNEGDAATPLWTNSEGHLPTMYILTMPDGSQNSFVLPAGDTEISLDSLFTTEAVTEWNEQDLADAMDAYRAEIEAQITAIDAFPGVARLATGDAAGVTSVHLRTPPDLALRSGTWYAVIDVGTTEAEVRRITGGTGDALSFTMPLQFEHHTNDPVLLVSDPQGVHVGWFGALPSNSEVDATRNTTAINRALDTASAMPNLGGQLLYKCLFGAGTYFINGELRPDRNVTLQGMGVRTTMLQAAATFAFPDGNTAMIHQVRSGEEVEWNDPGVSDRVYIRDIGLHGKYVYVPGVETTIRNYRAELGTAAGTVTVEAFGLPAVGDPPVNPPTTIQISSTQSLGTGYIVAVLMDNGAYWDAPITAMVAGVSITIAPGLPDGRSAPVGTGVHVAHSTAFALVTEEAPEGAVAIPVTSIVTFVRDQRVVVQLDNMKFHHCFVAFVDANLITIDTPIPAGRSVPVNHGVHHIQIIDVWSTAGFEPDTGTYPAGSTGDLHRAKQIRMGSNNEYALVLDVIDANRMSISRPTRSHLLADNPATTPANEATKVHVVTQAANGVLISIQQPCHLENVYLEAFRGYGMNIMDTVHGHFLNMQALDCDIGFWLRGCSLGYFHGFNVEDSTRAHVILDGSYNQGTVNYCRWNHFIGTHMEGHSSIGAAAWDVRLGANNFWLNAYLGDAHGANFGWRFGDTSLEAQAQPYMIIGASVPDSSSGNCWAYYDVDRKRKARSSTDLNGYIGLMIGSSHAQGTAEYAIELPGLAGRGLKLGAPARQALNLPLIEMRADNVATLSQPHFIGYDIAGVQSSMLTPDGVLTARRVVISGTGTPIATVLSNAGSLATVSVVGSDRAGTITLRPSGTGIVAGFEVCNIQFAAPFAVAPVVQVDPGNIAASDYEKANNAYASSVNTTRFRITPRGVALVADTDYVWTYSAIS